MEKWALLVWKGLKVEFHILIISNDERKHRSIGIGVNRHESHDCTLPGTYTY
jgi:hypothetical protein